MFKWFDGQGYGLRANFNSTLPVSKTIPIAYKTNIPYALTVRLKASRCCNFPFMLSAN